MKVQINHIKDFSKSLTVCIRSEELFKELESIDPQGGYRIIGTIETKSSDILEALEEAYTLSNHTETNWLEGSQVVDIKDNDSVRSSSTGDVFLVNDNYYLVDAFGFKLIDYTNKCLVDIC